LIELLAVIVILGIILAIAVPGISKIIDSVKQSSYDSQVNLILDAAKKYTQINAILPTSNTSSIITLKELQDNKYISTNIIDQRTGRAIPDSTWIVIRNDNGYHYDFGYMVDGLVLQYDAIFNGGLNIHNDNASANKGKWEDLSGNNNDSTLSQYNYDTNSGWTSNGLRSAVGYTGSVLQDTTFTNMHSFTVEVFGNFSVNVGSSTWPRIISTNGSYTNSYQGINGIDLTCTSTSSTSLLGFISNGVAANYTQIDNIGNMGLMSIAYEWNYDTKKLSVYRDGVKVKEYSITLYDNVNIDKIGLSGAKTATAGGYLYHTVRVYNRSLRADEINSNYKLDKLRYGY
jgi:type IV pilus assembly protein PilA